MKKQLSLDRKAIKRYLDELYALPVESVSVVTRAPPSGPSPRTLSRKQMLSLPVPAQDPVLIPVSARDPVPGQDPVLIPVSDPVPAQDPVPIPVLAPVLVPTPTSAHNSISAEGYLVLVPTSTPVLVPIPTSTPQPKPTPTSTPKPTPTPTPTSTPALVPNPIDSRVVPKPIEKPDQKTSSTKYYPTKTQYDLPPRRETPEDPPCAPCSKSIPILLIISITIDDNKITGAMTVSPKKMLK